MSFINFSAGWLEKTFYGYFSHSAGQMRRFVALYEAYGINRNQIPRFLGHGLTPRDMLTNENLLKVLTEDMIQDTCDTFGICREWLEGAQKQIYPLHDFYKNLHEFKAFIEKLKSTERDIDGVLFVPEQPKAPDGFSNEALLVLEEPIKELGERNICRYHLCDNWYPSYWKSRAYLAACIALCWKNGIHIIGRKVPSDFIRKYSQGQAFLEQGLEGHLLTPGEFLYPEDWALKPESFLDGIDPEKDSFGLTSGLEFWLRLQSEGFMETGIAPSKECRPHFERKLLELPKEKKDS